MNDQKTVTYGNGYTGEIDKITLEEIMAWRATTKVGAGCDYRYPNSAQERASLAYIDWMIGQLKNGAPAAGEKPGKSDVMWTGKGVIVPLADVQHVETHNPLGLLVVTRHTRWDTDSGNWANNLWIDAGEAEDFKAAWRRYLERVQG